MTKSAATTVKQYLDELPPERRAVISALRKLIKKHLPKGYAERMNWGGISYEIPLKRYPDTYNGQPLSYMGLAAQKHHYGLYAMCCYVNDERAAWLRAEFKKAGKKLDMGKSCIRFKKLDDLPLPAIAKLVETVTPDEYIEYYEQSRVR